MYDLSTIIIVSYSGAAVYPQVNATSMCFWLHFLLTLMLLIHLRSVKNRINSNVYGHTKTAVTEYVSHVHADIHHILTIIKRQTTEYTCTYHKKVTDYRVMCGNKVISWGEGLVDQTGGYITNLNYGQSHIGYP